MKNILLLTTIAFVLGVAAPAVHAAKGKKKDQGPDVFAEFDKNHNGVLDDDEKEAIKAAFKEGNAAVKKYDFNGDGKLDDGEIAAIQPAAKKKKKNK